MIFASQLVVGATSLPAAGSRSGDEGFVVHGPRTMKRPRAFHGQTHRNGPAQFALLTSGWGRSSGSLEIGRLVYTPGCPCDGIGATGGLPIRLIATTCNRSVFLRWWIVLTVIGPPPRRELGCNACVRGKGGTEAFRLAHVHTS
jgi:hypothetical protein